jgi:Tol biopolymer transport system component/DNA-binding winged helix-turn-helix (wHTH) protein
MDDDNAGASATVTPLKTPFRVGGWTAEPDWHRISRGNESRKLEPRVMHLLAVLAAAPGRPLTREQLLDAVWPNLSVNEDALSRAISQLRRALSDDPRNPAYIETVHKGGYCLVASVAPAGNRPQERPRDVRSGRWSLRLAAAGAAALAILVATVLLLRGASSEAPAAKNAYVPVPLTSEAGREIDPAISRDGKRLAFSASAEQGYDLFWQTIGDDRSVRLTHDGRFAESPAWSPSGDRIAYLSSNSRGGAIHIVTVATGRSEKLVDLRNWSFGLDWSPDGRTIAYGDSTSGEARSIMLLDVETGVRRPITRSDSWRGDGKPAFSPDGRRLAFVRDAGLGLSRILVVDLANPETPRVLTGRPEEIRGLDWDPSGAALIYSARSGDRFSLWRIGDRGSAPQPIPTEGGDLFSPSVSAGGVLVAEAVERDSDIWRARADGQGAAPFIRSTRDDFDPAQAPGAGQIAFASARSGSSELWLAEPDGANPRQITRLGRSQVGGPIWSPDGRRLAFRARLGGYAAVYLVPSAGRTPALIAGGGNRHHIPLGWGRTSQVLFIASGSGLSWTVVWRDLGSGRSRELNAVPARLAGVAPDGQSVYLITEDGAKLTWVPVGPGKAQEFALPGYLRAADAMRSSGGHFHIFVPAPGGTTIYRLKLAGSRLAFDRVALVPGYGQISFSPNEASLLFTKDRESSNDVVLMRL